MQLEKADDVRRLAEEINTKASLGLDLSKVIFLRSQRSKTTAIARTLGLPPQWRYVFGEDKIYIIEVISEKFDKLTCHQKIYVVVHELLHIPSGMKGGLRNHTYREFRNIRKIIKEKGLDEICW